MPCYTAYLLTIVNICLSSVYLSLRLRHEQSDGSILPTWQTFATVVLSSLLLLVYILSLFSRNQLRKNRVVFYIHTGVLVFLIAFYFGVSIKSIAADLVEVSPSTYDCIHPSVRCNIGIWQVLLAFIFIPFGVFELSSELLGQLYLARKREAFLLN
jgi:hypothetical protein